MGRGGVRRAALFVLGSAATIGLGTATAFAVSDGNYDPERQHCSPGANDTVNGDTAEEGCKSAIVVVGDGSGHEYAGFGTDQTAEGETVGPPGAPWVSPTGGDPASRPSVYIGADDNLNNGEHDGSDQMGTGPSDGGGIRFAADPASVEAWLAAVMADPFQIFVHPVPIVDAGIGVCADGVCFTAQTGRRTVFTGDDPCEAHDLEANGESLEECRARTADTRDRQVTNYEGHEWDPDSCSGPSDAPEDCGGRPLEDWNEQERTVYADPGLSVYEDPDAQGSPLDPYPLTAVYVGTCGVVVGGGPAAQVPASPITNGAGQAVVTTPGC